MNGFPDLQALGGDDGESTPQALGLLIGTQVRPVENCVHLSSVILSLSLPQTMLPTMEHWEQPAWPVNGFPDTLGASPVQIPLLACVVADRGGLRSAILFNGINRGRGHQGRRTKKEDERTERIEQHFGLFMLTIKTRKVRGAGMRRKVAGFEEAQ